MYKGIYILDPRNSHNIYGPEEREEIAKRVEIVGPEMDAKSVLKDLSVLKDVEFIFSGWGAPVLDKVFLDAAPKLKAFFYGAGSVKSFIRDDFWERDILLCSAWGANGVPVAEFTFAQIILSLKNFWHYSRVTSDARAFPPKPYQVAGAFDSTVGLVSLGLIGRLVLERLKTLDLNVIAYDPFVPEEQGEAMGVTMVGLDELFERSDVITCHTPWLKETEKMLNKKHFASMKKGGTFINTARGAVVDEDDLCRVLQAREDLHAILDVTYPEPPAKDSLLFELPNVIVTPHIAGSMQTECRRMGRYMIDELDRFITGRPLQWALTREKTAIMA